MGKFLANWWGVILASAVPAYVIYRYFRAWHAGPVIRANEIVFQEWFASGNSEANIITKMGGGRNCVRLVVTHDRLWVTSWFPFSLLSNLYDMEHLIPLQGIVRVERTRFLWYKGFLLTYVDANGRSHVLRLFPKQEEKFLGALQLPSDKLYVEHDA